MSEGKLPYFGQFNGQALEQYYSAEIEINDSKVSLDLNFEDESIDENTFQAIKNFLGNIHQFNEENKSLIWTDFKAHGESFDYINFFFEELSEEQLSAIINIADKNIPKEEQLLNKLKLIRICLYPSALSDDSYFGIFDYSIYIDGEPCNQLLAVATNENGELDHITWES